MKKCLKCGHERPLSEEEKANREMRDWQMYRVISKAPDYE